MREKANDGGRHCKPGMIFSLAHSLAAEDIPKVWPDPTRDGSRIAEQFGVRQYAASAYTLSNGEKLLEGLPAVVSELASQATPNLAELLEWEIQRGELRWIVEQFLRPVLRLPAMLWMHTMCWTDRCQARTNLGGDIDAKSPDVRQYGPGQPVRLRFDYWRRPAGSWRGHWRPRNYVQIRPERLRWLMPPGMAHWAPRFVRYRDDSEVVRGLEVVSGTHRERLGAADLSADYLTRLRAGLLPALDDRTYGLWKDPDTGLLRVLPEGVSSTNLLGVPAGRLIDGVGIWNVQILKIQRFFERPGTTGWRDILYDELRVNFDRLTSRVVFIGVTHDRVGGYGTALFGASEHARALARIIGP
jgi:hypothetical protein